MKPGSILEVSLDWGDLEKIPTINHGAGWNEDVYRSICEMARDAGYPAVLYYGQEITGSDKHQEHELLIFDTDAVKINIHNQKRIKDGTPITESKAGINQHRVNIMESQKVRSDFAKENGQEVLNLITKGNHPAADLDVASGLKFDRPRIGFGGKNKKKPRPPIGMPKLPSRRR